jgi:2-oxoglutarate ferredoxin oxidoreductase subunit alpha
LETKVINPGGFLIVPDSIDTNKIERKDIKVIKLPVNKLLDDLDKRFLNSIYFGAFVGLVSDNRELITESIVSQFNKKSEDIKIKNIAAAFVGYDFIKEHLNEKDLDVHLKITKVKEDKDRLFLSGNDAAALGALKAGVKFVGEYPMTPSSSFLHFFAAREMDYKLTVKQTEDELAAMNMVIGASVAGVRAMTATSGGGFALMNEALGFAGIAEVPLVCFEAQRGGPSTGIPTYTEQSDLKFVINSAQGEIPLVVLAPGDVEEAFYEGFEAFNIAEKLQTPVIVLLDKHMAASRWTVDKFDTSNLKIDRGKYIPLSNKPLVDYKRYRFTDDGISPRCVPGQPGGIHIASSYEHDETGWTCEDGRNHELMQEKRFKKLKAIPKEKLRPKLYGPEKADLTLVGWGSTKTSVLDAIKYLNQDGYSVNYLHFVYINPMDNEYVKNLLESLNDVMILEGNFTAQLRDIIREKTGFYIENTYLKYDARPFYFQDIYSKVKEYLDSKKGGNN